MNRSIYSIVIIVLKINISIIILSNFESISKFIIKINISISCKQLNIHLRSLYYRDYQNYSILVI